MKKSIIATILAMIGMQYVLADNISPTANIKIKITGENPQNTYFLCLQNVGCLSIQAAKFGKVYPVNRDIPMSPMFLVNQNTRELFNQGLPTSCKGEVKINQTVTISGKLERGSNHAIHIKQFSCSIT